MEARQGGAAALRIKSGAVKCFYKVAGQRRVIGVVDLPDAETLGRTIMARLPKAEYLEFEAIWPLREYEPFIEDSVRGCDSTAAALSKDGKIVYVLGTGSMFEGKGEDATLVRIRLRERYSIVKRA